jgi:hypothetical protein
LLAVEPFHRSAPQFTQTLGPEVAELSEMVGFAPDPEQRLGLDLLFALNGSKSAAFEFCVICSRQNLKTGLFKQAALGWLYVTRERLIVWSAHEFRTTLEALRDMIDLIYSSKFLSDEVKTIKTAAGQESIELKTGQRLMFKARTKSGGRGLSGNKVVLDEAFALQPDHMGALLPTLSVQPDPQVVYGSSAGLETSEVLRGIRDRGRPGISPRLAYLEWGTDRGGCEQDPCTHDLGVPGCALDDVENWRQANPLLGRTRANGTGLTVEYVQAERQALPPLEFARERLGWWDEPGAAAVFGPGRWQACATTDRPDGLPVAALAVAVSWELTHGAIAAAAQDGEDMHLKPLQHGRGTSWLVARAKELQDRHQVDVVIDGKGPAAALIDDLETARVQLKVADTTDVLDACSDLFDRVQERKARHGSYPELEAAVSVAVKRNVGDRWAWGRRQTEADISVLEAVTLASWWAAQIKRVPAIF